MFFLKDPFTDSVTGPVEASALKQLAAEGAIDTSWGISRAIHGPWQSVGTVKGLVVKSDRAKKDTAEVLTQQEPGGSAPASTRSIPNGGQSSTESLPSRSQSLASAAQAIRSQFESVKRSHFTSPESVLDIFDWKFKKYLTPWILRITWAIVLCIAPLFIAVQLLQIIGIWLPDLSWAADARPDVNVRVPQGTSGPLLPWWFQVRVARSVWQVASIAGTAIAMLWIRVFLEIAIVLFNIATTLTSIESGIHKRLNQQD
jgi:hypothetical protein